MELVPPDGGAGSAEIYRLFGNGVVNFFVQGRTIVKENAIKVVLAIRLLKVGQAHPMEDGGRFDRRLFAVQVTNPAEVKIAVNENCGWHIRQRKAPRGRQPRNQRRRLLPGGCLARWSIRLLNPR